MGIIIIETINFKLMSVSEITPFGQVFYY